MYKGVQKQSKVDDNDDNDEPSIVDISKSFARSSKNVRTRTTLSQSLNKDKSFATTPKCTEVAEMQSELLRSVQKLLAKELTKLENAHRLCFEVTIYRFEQKGILLEAQTKR